MVLCNCVLSSSQVFLGVQKGVCVDSRFRLFMSRHWSLLNFFYFAIISLERVQFNLILISDFSTQFNRDCDKPLEGSLWSNQDFVVHVRVLFRSLVLDWRREVQCISGNGFHSTQRTSPESRHWIAQRRFRFRRQESMGIAHSFLTGIKHIADLFKASF